MAKKKNKKKNLHNAVGVNAAPISGERTLQNFAHKVFNERIGRFQKNGSAIDSVYEGLDFDAVRVKRRISSILSVAEHVTQNFSEICPDTPKRFSLAEDWVLMNSYPVSAFDHIEKYVFSTLGATIWLLDHIRDNGKTEHLNEILRNAPLPGNIPMPDVWDPCHSQQTLRHVVNIINNRNSDSPITEKAIRKNKATVARIYMDRSTAENRIDHNVPSRQLYDQIISLVDPQALAAIEDYYVAKYWEWLRRYFLCRDVFNQEEQKIRAEIDDFHTQLQALTAQNTVLSQKRKQLTILSNASSKELIPTLESKPASDHLVQLKTLDYQNKILYEKQEEFNARFNAFTREVGEFSLTPLESIIEQYGQEIAQIWEGFEIDDPYSMCMAFLSLLDHGSDLPWCYFPSVALQSCYVSMLPWTRTRYIPSCDDIWEHYDADAGAIIPGPSTHPLSKKIKVPDLDNWYRMQYRDTAKSKSEHTNLFNLSHIVYEATGCIMPRNPERHLAALNTLNRYGINNKKANQNLLYCMSLLGEAKNQTLVSHLPVTQNTEFEIIPDNSEDLEAQVIALREELTKCRQALQDAINSSTASADQILQLKQDLNHRNFLVHDLSNIVFDSKLPTATKHSGFPYRTASYFAVFSADDAWIKDMDEKLPDVLFFKEFPKANPEILRTADTIWIQPKDLSYDAYRRIITEARKNNVPVRIFPFTDATSCAVLLVQTDISR